MSQIDHTFRKKLEQQLERIKQEGDEADWLRAMVEWLLQEMLKLEFKEFIGTEPYGRKKERAGYRNGYRERDLVTRVDQLTLRVPRDREGRFCTDLFERYQRSEKALVLALQESCLQGVSTRKMKRITEKLCGVGFSKDQVSRMAQALDQELEQWRSRPLEKSYPYLVLDAHYEYVTEDGQIESEGVLKVKGIDDQGYREIFGVKVATGEEKASWEELLANLLQRGLDPKAVHCVVSDEHKGLRAAMLRYLPGALWQRCQTHFQRSAGPKVPIKARAEVHSRLRDIFNAPDLETALDRAGLLIQEWRDRFPELVAWLDETIEEPLAVFALPSAHRQRMRTTNGLERYHEKRRRRSRVIRIFPNRASCIRLSSALAMEQSEDRLTGHRYLNMKVLEEEHD
jgi:putative transposase